MAFSKKLVRINQSDWDLCIQAYIIIYNVVDETKRQLKTLYAKIHGVTPLTRVVCIINLKTIV